MASLNSWVARKNFLKTSFSMVLFRFLSKSSPMGKIVICALLLTGISPGGD
jgi:hypothetical protein